MNNNAHHNNNVNDDNGQCCKADRTPLMLIHEITKLSSNILRGDEHRVHNSYRMLLFHLVREDGKTQLELAKLCHLRPPTVSVTLQKMEQDGYVIRVPDENDLRQTRVYLTEKGLEYDLKIRKMMEELEYSIIKDLTDEEYIMLTELLCRIRNKLIKEGKSAHRD